MSDPVMLSLSAFVPLTRPCATSLKSTMQTVGSLVLNKTGSSETCSQWFLSKTETEIESFTDAFRSAWLYRSEHLAAPGQEESVPTSEMKRTECCVSFLQAASVPIQDPFTVMNPEPFYLSAQRILSRSNVIFSTFIF